MKKRFFLVSIIIVLIVSFILSIFLIMKNKNRKITHETITEEILLNIKKKEINEKSIELIKDINPDFSLLENMYMVTSKMNFDYLLKKNIEPLFSNSEDWLHHMFDADLFNYEKFDKDIRLYSYQKSTYLEKLKTISYGVISTKKYEDGELLLRYTDYYDHHDNDYIICNMIVQKNSKLYIYSYFTYGTVTIFIPSDEEQNRIDTYVDEFYKNLSL